MMELYALINYIRGYSEIPIELFHIGDLNSSNKGLINAMSGVTIVDMSKSSLFTKRLAFGKDTRNYYIKPLAMMLTSFENAIYLDSDAFPLLHLDSQILAKTLKYLDVVDMFLFRDYWLMNMDNPIYKALDMDYFTQRQADSGIIAFKKSKVESVLMLSYFISREVYFDNLFFGDKDTFWFANAYLKTLDPSYASTLYMNTDMVSYLGDSLNDLGMLHTIDGEPAFAHLNGLKFVLNSYGDYDIHIFEKSFERLQGYSILSTLHDFDDDFTQNFLLYKFKDSTNNYKTIPIEGSTLFTYYVKSFNQIQIGDPTRLFYFKWSLYLVLFTYVAIAIVKSIKNGLESKMGKNKCKFSYRPYLKIVTSF